MGAKGFHNKPYDAGTLAKLQIFELYAQEWIPVFLAPKRPKFDQVHIFDFFCGPGKDVEGKHGSPLRILNQLRRYHRKRLAGWNKVRIVVHLFDKAPEKIATLKRIIESDEWSVPGVHIDCRPLAFEAALAEHRSILRDAGVAKLLIIDQYGVDAVSDVVFRQLVGSPRSDFIFFLSSSTLHRFRNHPAIKQKIEKPEHPYNVHRAAVKYYRDLLPPHSEFFLGSFSIKKRSNIYGLIFGSHHPLGIHKFLRVAWAADEIAGEANFDIEREGVTPGEGILPLDVMRPKKIQAFEAELDKALRAGSLKSEAEVVRFCIERGMTCQHAAPIIKRLGEEGVIEVDFRVPDVRRIHSPRRIRVIGK